MKFIQSAIQATLILGIANFAGGGAPVSQAREVFSNKGLTLSHPPSWLTPLLPGFPAREFNHRPHPSTFVGQRPSRLLVSQLSTKADLALLAKASAAFLQHDRYQTESDIQVEATSGSTHVTSTAKAITIVQSPNQLYAEITFPPSKSAMKAGSTVVSDGKQVWMYRSDLKQYAVTTPEKFDEADDNYWVGMSSLWFLQIPQDIRQPIAAGALSDPKVQKEAGLTDDLPLAGGQQTVNGEQLYVYEYTDKDGFGIRTFVEPATATLRQIVITGKSEGYDVVITERIRRRTPSPAVTPNTFKFSPPKGSKLVKTLSLGPL